MLQRAEGKEQWTGFQGASETENGGGARGACNPGARLEYPTERANPLHPADERNEADKPDTPSCQPPRMLVQTWPVRDRAFTQQALKMSRLKPSLERLEPFQGSPINPFWRHGFRRVDCFRNIFSEREGIWSRPRCSALFGNFTGTKVWEVSLVRTRIQRFEFDVCMMQHNDCNATDTCNRRGHGETSLPY